MQYEGNIIRPPSEADSILLQVTVGCSHNKCTFCGAYKDKRFKIKDDLIIFQDIEYASRHFQDKKRVFLCDGDVMIIPQERLVRILEKIKADLPWISRVGIYANAKSLHRKSLEDLKDLRSLGLGIVYMGLESGDDETLLNVRKKGDSKFIIREGQKVRAAGIKLSITVVLGLAGPERSEIHAKETGRALSEMDPEFVGALSLMLVPGTPLYEEWQERKFILMEAVDLLKELRTMILHTQLSRGLFLSNHASNYLPLRFRMPKGKESALQIIDRALSGDLSLRPEWMRGL
jgi:radical SAM superfamily enzyme YgiQ (UPF0313 family)